MPKDSFCPRHIASSAALQISNCCVRRMRRFRRNRRSLGEPGPGCAAAQCLRTVDHGFHCREGKRVAARTAQDCRFVSASPGDRHAVAGRSHRDLWNGPALRREYSHGGSAIDGPYNTYTRVGLPPTPIALAGAAAIRATARPEKTDAMYFVASTKDDGSHVFSATLESTMQRWPPMWRISAKAAQDCAR